MPEKKTNNAGLIYAALFAMALFTALSSTYNPIHLRRMHVDSSVYVTISQGITRGELPYRDFADNKGPLLYLLNAAGLSIGGFTGVWFVELFFLCVFVFFAYKTALFFGNGNSALSPVLCACFMYLAFFTVCAGSEEYSVPFIMISFYLFTKYYFSGGKISFIELMILGFCFVCAMLIRLNVFPLWAAFCAVIFIETIAKKQFASLFKYIAGFLAGILIAAAPAYLYLRLNGIFDDFLYQVIIGGAKKGFESGALKQTMKNFYVVLDRYFCIIPLLYGLLNIITHFKRERFSYYLGYGISYLLMVFFMSTTQGDSHYNLVLVPYFIPLCADLSALLRNKLGRFRRKSLLVFIVMCVVFSGALMKYMDDFVEVFTDTSGDDLIAAGKLIDKNTEDGDEIISLGFTAYIYPFTQRRAASKYFYQGSGIDNLPESRPEFLHDVLSKKPKIIAILDDNGYTYLSDWYAPIYKLIDSEYTLLSDEYGYYLFKYRL